MQAHRKIAHLVDGFVGHAHFASHDLDTDPCTGISDINGTNRAEQLALRAYIGLYDKLHALNQLGARFGCSQLLGRVFFQVSTPGFKFGNVFRRGQ